MRTVALAALPVLITTLVALLVVGAGHEKRAIQELTGLTRLLVDHFPVSATSTAEIDLWCERSGRTSNVRVTLIDSAGNVLGDSHFDPGRMENHGTRIEFVDALNGKTGFANRESRTLREPWFYIAVPVRDGDRLLALRVAMPRPRVSSDLSTIALLGFLATVLAAIVGAIAGGFLVRRIVSSIRTVEYEMQRLARGELPDPKFSADIDELEDLHEATVALAERHEKRVQLSERQQSEMEGILSSMNDALFAVDGKARVLHANKAAVELVGATAAKVPGQPLVEWIRQPEIQRVVDLVLGSGAPVVLEFDLRIKGDLRVICRGTPLRAADDEAIGALLVLSDVTALRKLENMRRDFVENVSHEIRTPVTSISGSAETLRDMDWNETESVGKFLDMIVRQSRRLVALTDDILALARVEQAGDRGGIEREKRVIDKVIKHALDSCREAVRAKDITVHSECDADLVATINEDMIERALTNLIMNATQYSAAETEIFVTAKQDGGDLILSVRDQGPGIEARHHDRLFERFYRVDRNRSRNLGGTGLGLAIVKHIALAHGGGITIQSALGEGSTFQIRMPISAE